MKLERATQIVAGTLRPVRDHIVVKASEWQPSTIIEIAGNRRKTLAGIVVAVGPGAYWKKYRQPDGTWGDTRHATSAEWKYSTQFRPTQVRVGDKVELGALERDGADFQELWIDNALHVICTEKDVVGVHA